MAAVRIGISGWRYAPWRGIFYPSGLPQRSELQFASRAVRSIEINGSFYSLQRPSSYLAWKEASPADFVFAVKGGRFITHNKKLRDCRAPLANFFASGVLALGNKLGPVLWQLPPQLGFDARRMADFFALLPRTMRAAAKLAKSHDKRLSQRAWLEVEKDHPIRHAIEVRHPSFDDPAAMRLLRKHDIGLCVADMAGKWPALYHVTSDFVYVRLHGAKQLYVSGYDGRALDEWAARVASWRDGGRDVYVYFDNDAKVRAPYDAMNLAARLGEGERVVFPRKRKAAESSRPRRRSP